MPDVPFPFRKSELANRFIVHARYFAAGDSLRSVGPILLSEGPSGHKRPAIRQSGQPYPVQWNRNVV
jgi:hypothetical protein